MSYRIVNVFCAVPGDLEEARTAFYQAVGQVNESRGMRLGVLYAPLALQTEVSDKPRIQHAIDHNIRISSYFILALDGSWGPPQRNFERDYQLALQCQADPSMPMQEVVVFLATGMADRAMEPSVAELRNLLAAGSGPRHFEFRDRADIESKLRELLSEWLAAPEPEVTRREADNSDADFVRRLIMETVAEELGMATWPEELRGPLLNIQYQARIKSYRENFPSAVEEILHVDGEPAGWVVVNRSDSEIRLVDIAILSRYRGNKLGTRRITELIEESERQEKPVRLSVVATNRALRLYQRLGFVPTGGDGVRVFMERKPGSR